MDESEETPGFVAPAATDERPYETMDESEETPGFVAPAPAAKEDKPYETIDESEESPTTPGTLDRSEPSPINTPPLIDETPTIELTVRLGT